MRTSEEERYWRMLSVAPLRIMVWRTMRALKTTWGHDYSRMREHKRSGRTMTFGSRNLGDRALQTSCTAPSSDQVAAMMGSRYCEMGCAVTVSTR